MGTHDPLSAVDRVFLDIEGPTHHMHIASVGILEGDPLRGEDGTIDLERILAYMASRLHRVPRYRQRVVASPTGTLHWVDDERFNLRYHVRHTALPPPGTERQLKRMAGRVFSQKLDRDKPLWEVWLVEGLEDGRIAMITRVHHSMVDGVAGSELLAAVLGFEPTDTIEDAKPWTPEPQPSPMALLQESLAHRLGEQWKALAQAREALKHPKDLFEKLTETAKAAETAAEAWGTPTGPSPLNDEIGPHRRFDWVDVDLEAIKEVKRALGGKVNDVVLAVTSLALRRFFLTRGTPPAELDAHPFRVFCPVNMRRPDGAVGPGGNRVVMVVVELPLHLDDPLEVYRQTRAAMDRVKDSHQAEGIDLAATLGEWGSPLIVNWVVRATYMRVPANLVVTNVHGPPFPLYLLGAKMTAAYPLVPLYGNHSLGIALFSYAGRVHWGFNACWDKLPDLHDLVEATEDAIARLREAAADPGAPRAAGPSPG